MKNEYVKKKMIVAEENVIVHQLRQAGLVIRIFIMTILAITVVIHRLLIQVVLLIVHQARQVMTKFVTKKNGTVVYKDIVNNRRIMTKTTVDYDFEGEPTYTTVLYKFRKGRYEAVRCEWGNGIEESVYYIIDKAITRNEI